MRVVVGVVDGATAVVVDGTAVVAAGATVVPVVVAGGRVVVAGAAVVVDATVVVVEVVLVVVVGDGLTTAEVGDIGLIPVEFQAATRNSWSSVESRPVTVKEVAVDSVFETTTIHPPATTRRSIR